MAARHCFIPQFAAQKALFGEYKVLMGCFEKCVSQRFRDECSMTTSAFMEILSFFRNIFSAACNPKSINRNS